MGFKGETKSVLRAERGEKDRNLRELGRDVKKLAVRDRKRNTVVGVHLPWHRD